jgi:hypothetical protein
MTGHKSPEAQKLLKMIQAVPFNDEEKEKWRDSLTEDGITEEIADEIHKSLAALPDDKFSNDWEHAKYNMELAVLLKHWRMTQASKNFRHAGR